jgi:sRNA-binding protein
MANIAEAVMAAQRVDQQGVQSATKNTQKLTWAKSGGEDGKAEYNAYRSQQQQRGIPAVSFNQWKIMTRHSR